MERIKLVLISLFVASNCHANSKLFQPEAVGVCVLSAEMVASSGNHLGQSSFATISSVTAKACEREAAKSQEYRMAKVCNQALYSDRSPASEITIDKLNYKISYQFIPDKKGNSIFGVGQSGHCPKNPSVTTN